VIPLAKIAPRLIWRPLKLWHSFRIRVLPGYVTGGKLAKKAKAGKAKAKSRKAASKSAVRARTAQTARKPAKNTKAAKTKNAARAAASRKKETPPPKRTPAQSLGVIARSVASLTVAAVAKRLPWAKNQNDPLILLETDHRRFEKLLKDGEATTERAKKGRRDILNALTAELTVHEALEEKLVYPALEPHAEAHDLVLESFQEHHVADIVIKELHEVATDDEKWGAKFKVLKENVSHHISEEENKLFPIARGVLSREDLLALGARMRALKAELEGE
jgi:hemerythrin-like domain-containing protein